MAHYIIWRAEPGTVGCDRERSLSNRPGTDFIRFAGSELVLAGERAGLKTAHEVFADRTYQADGTLTSAPPE